MSNVKRNIKNSVYNVADVVFYPVVFFATIPFFMNQLGEEVFGLWMLMNTLIITFQLLNIGLAPAIVKYIALYRAAQDKQKLNEVITTTISISFILLVVSIVLGIILSVLVQTGNLFNLPSHLESLAAKTTLITSLIIGLKFTEQILLHVFKGLQRVDIYFFLNNGIKFSILLINIVQVLYFKSLVAMLLVNLCVTVIMLLVQVLCIKKILPFYKLQIGIDTFHKNEILRFGFYTWVQSVIVIFVFQMDRYIVVTKFGLVQLGYYALVSTIFVTIHTCFTATCSWLIPKVVAHTVSDTEDNKLFLSIRAFVTIISLLGLALFYLIYEPLFIWWLGTVKFKLMHNYIRLFTAFEFFYLLMIAPPMYLNYSNRIKAGTRIIYIVSIFNIVGLVVGYLIMKSAEGIIYGLLVSTFVATAIIYQQINKILIKKSFVTETLFFLALAAFACTLIWCNVFLIQLGIFVLLIVASWSFFIRYEKNKISILFD